MSKKKKIICNANQPIPRVFQKTRSHYPEKTKFKTERVWLEGKEEGTEILLKSKGKVILKNIQF